MKLIKQSFEILEQKDFTIKGIKQFVERCARVSYKSEDKMTDTSYEKFVGILESKDHARPLEFGTVHLKMNASDFNKIRSTLCLNKIYNDQWIKHYYVGDVTYVTTNYRYYLNILEIFPKVEKFFTEENNEYYPKRYTVHMILDRGVMDEFRTHVGLSHLAESTRYCNYSKHKFGNEVTFIKPCWLNIPLGDYGIASLPGDNILWLTGGARIFVDSLLDAEDYYLTLLGQGWTPQQARSVLPLGIKSELISCGFEDAWENFMRRRSPKYGDPGAHPMAAEIADRLCEEFLKRGFIDEKKI